MTPKQNTPAETADELPYELDYDEEMIELEELGIAADGSRMQIGDTAWNGEPWDPDHPAGRP